MCENCERATNSLNGVGGRDSLNRSTPGGATIMGPMTKHPNMAGPSIEKPPYEVQQEIVSIDEALNQLDGLIDRLYDKLNPILRPNEPISGASDKKPERPTDLGRYLHEKSDNINIAVNRLKSIISRVEL